MDTTLTIAVGTARGLTFLHAAEKSPAYRTFNASNILLNESFEPKLYFGSATLNQERGALPVLMRKKVNYTPPEYIATGQFSCILA
ncbi:hypothetical protein M8C21_007465 [Ambrosia artemisiifolia]|uniref:Uncharacterized protein n=1 Tax=Ambrosia artemisiifolia TaxID=4212 RepID=A0AAD5CML6_AMBAR|nr:hypothetical protein M8C21_007465 [Ambrosia artemisiifolia]